MIKAKIKRDSLIVSKTKTSTHDKPIHFYNLLIHENGREEKQMKTN